MLIKSRVLARQHGRDELWGDFAQRNLETIRAGKAAVNLPVDIVNGASLRHFPDVFHVEGLRPGAVKEKSGEHSARQQKKQRYLPAVTKKNISARFLRASKAGEQFHWLGNKPESSRTSRCAKEKQDVDKPRGRCAVSAPKANHHGKKLNSP